MINEYEELKYISCYKSVFHDKEYYVVERLSAFQRMIMSNGLMKAINFVNDFIHQNQIDDRFAVFMARYTKEIEKKSGIYKTPDNVKDYIKSEASK